MSAAVGPHRFDLRSEHFRGMAGRAEDIADAVLFLMKNTFVTGITLTVDGGRLLI